MLQYSACSARQPGVAGLCRTSCSITRPRTQPQPAMLTCWHIVKRSDSASPCAARAAFLCSRASQKSAVCRPSRGPRAKVENREGPARRWRFPYVPVPRPVTAEHRPSRLARLQDVRHRIGSITGQAMHNAIRCLPSSRYSWPSNDHGSPDLHDNSVTTQRPPHLPTMPSVPATFRMLAFGSQPDTRSYVQNFHPVQMRPRPREQERTDTTCMLL